MNRIDPEPESSASADPVHPQPPPIASGVRCHRSSSVPAIDLVRRIPTNPVGLGKMLLGDGREKVVLGEVLGIGGMGVVYAGFHCVVNRPVVIKVIRQEYANIPELVARFQREAEILGAIDSESVVKLLDCDVTTTGLPYMVLEKLEGHDLAVFLETHGKPKTNEALSIAREAARALAGIHANDVVHRDIKPDNLFLHTDTNGVRRVKLIDFGVALATAKKPSLTLPGTTMGSIHYMSPEQLTDCHSVTPASDVWSLGVVLFQLLSGELPFPTQSEAAFSAQVLNQPALNLRAVAPGVTKELAQLVARCLHKDPWKRYANGGELAAALTMYIENQRGKLRLSNALSSVRPKARRSTAQRTKAPAQRPSRWTRRHIAVAGVVAGITLGHFLPTDMRDNFSRATLGILNAPMQLVTVTH